MKSSDHRKWNPTIVLFVASFVMYLTALCLAVTLLPESALILAGLCVVQTLLVLAMYTPLHEATHRNVTKQSFGNDVILTLLSPVFVADLGLYRRLHLLHHAYANRDERDPDLHTAHPTLLGRWLKSFSLTASYYPYLFKYETRRFSPVRIAASMAIPFAILAVGYATGHLGVAAAAVVIPAGMAQGILSFAFTAWPHHPAQDPSRLGNARMSVGSKVFQYMMFNQNWHLIHHIKPSVRWYDYPAYWREHGAQMIAAGARVEGEDEVTRVAKYKEQAVEAGGAEAVEMGDAEVAERYDESRVI